MSLTYSQLGKFPYSIYHLSLRTTETMFTTWQSDVSLNLIDNATENVNENRFQCQGLMAEWTSDLLSECSTNLIRHSKCMLWIISLKIPRWLNRVKAIGRVQKWLSPRPRNCRNEILMAQSRHGLGGRESQLNQKHFTSRRSTNFIDDWLPPLRAYDTRAH
jgi:hypothetical protein